MCLVFLRKFLGMNLFQPRPLGRMCPLPASSMLPAHSVRVRRLCGTHASWGFLFTLIVSRLMGGLPCGSAASIWRDVASAACASSRQGARIPVAGILYAGVPARCTGTAQQAQTVPKQCIFLSNSPPKWQLVAAYPLPLWLNRLAGAVLSK